MIFGKSSTSDHPMFFFRNRKFCILFLGCFGVFSGAPSSALSQGEPSVQLREKYERNRRYFATIGSDSIEMNLVFDGTINPEYASVYEYFGSVSGDYRWMVSGKLVPVKGILWNPDSLSLFVPDLVSNQSYWLDMLAPDSIAFLDSNNPGHPLSVSETFSLHPTGGFWKKGNAIKPVRGIDFNARGLQRKVVLDATNARGTIHHVDVSELVCQLVGLSHEEWVGYSGWAETDVTLLEFTFVEGGVNVLLAIEVTGSCNTDRSYLLSCQLEANGAMGKAHLYQVGNCLFYGAEEGEDQAMNIVLYDLPEEGASTFTMDSLRCIGAFRIVQSEVIVQKAWSGITSLSPGPDGL